MTVFRVRQYELIKHLFDTKQNFILVLTPQAPDLTLLYGFHSLSSVLYDIWLFGFGVWSILDNIWLECQMLLESFWSLTMVLHITTGNILIIIIWKTSKCYHIFSRIQWHETFHCILLQNKFQIWMFCDQIWPLLILQSPKMV